jgi:hypothetical protein
VLRITMSRASITAILVFFLQPIVGFTQEAHLKTCAIKEFATLEALEPSQHQSIKVVRLASLIDLLEQKKLQKELVPQSLMFENTDPVDLTSRVPVACFGNYVFIIQNQSELVVLDLEGSSKIATFPVLGLPTEIFPLQDSAYGLNLIFPGASPSLAVVDINTNQVLLDIPPAQFGSSRIVLKNNDNLLLENKAVITEQTVTSLSLYHYSKNQLDEVEVCNLDSVSLGQPHNNSPLEYAVSKSDLFVLSKSSDNETFNALKLQECQELIKQLLE